MREKLLQLGSVLLETQPSDLELRGGKVFVKGTDRCVTLREIGHLAWNNSGILPRDWEGGLVVHYVYHAPMPPLESIEDGYGIFSLTYAPGVAIAVVEVDPATGKPEVLKFVCVEDPGRCINPMIVEGQVHGQIGHQLSSALYERLDYDADGHLLTSTWKDYLVPTAADMPKLETALLETPSLFTPLGTRGMAEGGGAPVIAAVNAIRDALAPLGIEINDSHLTPAELFDRIHSGSTV
jgi:CO/xanthine dehydrogenase Mo-binding subunit